MRLKEALELAHTAYDREGFIEAKKDLGRKIWVCVFTGFSKIKAKNKRIKFINDVLKGKKETENLLLGYGRLLGKMFYKNHLGKTDFQVVLFDFEFLIKEKLSDGRLIRTFHSSWADLGEKWFLEGQKEKVSFT